MRRCDGRYDTCLAEGRAKGSDLVSAVLNTVHDAEAHLADSKQKACTRRVPIPPHTPRAGDCAAHAVAWRRWPQSDRNDGVLVDASAIPGRGMLILALGTTAPVACVPFWSGRVGHGRARAFSRRRRRRQMCSPMRSSGCVRRSHQAAEPRRQRRHGSRPTPAQMGTALCGGGWVESGGSGGGGRGAPGSRSCRRAWRSRSGSWMTS
jgi:hypothetical protein